MVTGVLLSLVLLTVADHGNGCRHLEHVTMCFKPILQNSEYMLEQNEMLILAGDVKQIWTLCKHFFTGQGCLEENLRRCGRLGHLERDNLEIYFEGVVKRGVIRLCQDWSLIHKYSRYSDCFYNTKNDTGACLQESTLRFRSVEGSLLGSSLNELSKRHCGTIENLMSCGYNAISRSCGHTPGMLYLEIMQKFLPKRAVDVCIGPYMRLRHGASASQFQMTSGADSTPGTKQLYLGIISVLLGLLTVMFALVCMSSDDVDSGLYDSGLYDLS